MKKNYWPIAIVGIIVFGMVIISVGVTIAVKHPVVDERMFGAQKRVIDEEINEVLKEQRFFENLASVRFSVDGRTMMLQNPYDKAFSKPNVSKSAKDFFYIDVASECELAILPKSAEFSDFKISSVALSLSSLSADFTDTSEVILNDKQGSYKFFLNDFFALKSGIYTMEVSIELVRELGSADSIKAFFQTKVEIASNE